jgi:hypothetical protein
MNDRAQVILERTMFHLRAYKRIALETDDVAAYQLTHEALCTVQGRLKSVKREQQARREHTAQLRRAA